MSKISVTTIAGLTSGGDANKVKIESGDTLQVESNATVGGTLTTTGATTLNGGATVLGNTIVNPDTAGKSTFQLTSQAANDAKLIMKSDTTDKVTIHANGTTVLNGGSVTMPSQPSFMARNHGQVANNAAYVQASPMICYTIDHNIGSHYSTSNGRFTAPVAGRYMYGFSFGICRTDNNETMYPYFRKNGSQLHYQYWAPSGLTNLHAPISFSACINLAAGDYLDIQVGGTGDWYAGLQETMMWGYLIG